MYQWDIAQAYVDFAIPGSAACASAPVSSTPWPARKSSTPTGNLLYSHSFLFDYAIPFTQTGAYATYGINDKLTIDIGSTRGWDTSLKSYNDNWDGIGRLTYAFSDSDTTAASWTSIVGKDEPVRNSKCRELLDVILTTNVNEHAARWRSTATTPTRTTAPPSAGRPRPSGSARPATSPIGIDRPLAKTPMFALNGRVEYFNDDKGVRVPGAIGTGVELVEGTIGLAITPFPDNAVLSNLVFRPEFRFDYANKRFFDAGANRYQYTAAIDAIFKF